MQNIKNTPEWKQYEWLITKIFYDDYSELQTSIVPNTKLHGEKSKISRQIDILIEKNNIKTIIECKHHKRPLDVKAIESFISMFDDIKGNYGIIITSGGFTKSAYNRIEEYPIKLEHLKWEDAYINSFNEQSYGRINDICNHCNSNFKIGKEIPGLLLWDSGYGLEKDGKVYIYHIAECLKCNNKTLYCDSCGITTIVGKDEPCCQEAIIFINNFNT